MTGKSDVPNVVESQPGNMVFTYAPPAKHSITIAGHETALTIEPVFWNALRAAAVHETLPLNALVARIDAERIAASHPPNLASAVRQWLYQNLVNANFSQEP